jgi:phosphoribosylformylglycinamidine cyclo-ligase
MSQSYEQSGVSLEAGYESVRRIKKHIAKTERLGMMGNIGGFGGMFDLSLLNMKEPILVSGTDGVGTKLKLAFLIDKHDTIGQDVVAMCVNDVLAQGAQPLFFLDYIAVGKNNPAQIEQIVKGVADGCVLANCSLIGGETAEMPDMYQEGEYDIAGFTVGAVEKSKLIDGSKVSVGNILIGIQSSGVHSNGFSLVRKIVIKDHNLDLFQYFHELNGKLGETLLAPTRIYVKPVLEVLKTIDVHAICHITGGGFDENIPRVLKENQSVEIIEDNWEKPPVFSFLEKWGNIPHREMFNVFNMGIGMIIIVKKEDVETTLNILNNCGEKAFEIGKVVEKKLDYEENSNICIR